jgi:hypothetical protein
MTTTETQFKDMTATVVRDHLNDEGEFAGEYPSEVGRVFILNDIPVDAETATYTCRARDDDGELYYTLRVTVPLDDTYQEDTLCILLTNLGSWAGVTSIAFDGHHELDCS